MSGGLSDEDVEVQARALADRLDQSRAVLERAREIRVERGTWPPRDTPPAPVAVVSVLTVLKDVKAGLERLQSGFEGVKARLDLVFREGDSGAGREVGVLGGAGDLREGLADGRAVGEGIAAALEDFKRLHGLGDEGAEGSEVVLEGPVVLEGGGGVGQAPDQGLGDRGVRHDGVSPSVAGGGAGSPAAGEAIVGGAADTGRGLSPLTCPRGGGHGPGAGDVPGPRAGGSGEGGAS